MTYKTITPGPNFRGYVKNYNAKTGTMKGTHSGFDFAAEVTKMVKELEDPSRTHARKGSGMKAHVDGTLKLREMDVDPLDMLMKHSEKIDQMVRDELASASPRSKYLTDLLAMKTRILEAVLPYRYGKAPITTVEQLEVLEPVRIIFEDASGSNDEVSGPNS